MSSFSHNSHINRANSTFVPGHVNHELEFSKVLDRLGDTAMTGEDDNDDIGAAFKKFAVVTKELSAQMRNLVRRWSPRALVELRSS